MSMNPGTAILGRLARSMFKVVLDRLNEIDSRMEQMTQATTNLDAKVDELATAVGEAVDQIESELAAIKAVPAAPASTAAPEDTAAINASADRISTLTGTIRSAIAAAKVALAPAAPADTVAGGGSDTISGSLGNDSVESAPVSSAPGTATTFGA